MGSIVTADMITNVMQSVKRLNEKFDDLLAKVERTTYTKYNTVHIDNTNMKSFEIAPFDELPLGSPDMCLGTSEKPFSQITLNDTVMVKDSSIFLRVDDDRNPGIGSTNVSHTRPITAVDTQNVLDVIKSLTVNINDKNELILIDDYHFLCQASNSTVFMNLTKLMSSMIMFIQSLDERVLQHELIIDGENNHLNMGSSTSPTAESHEHINDISNQLLSTKADFDNYKKTITETLSNIKQATNHNTKKVNDLWGSVISVLKDSEAQLNQRDETLKQSIANYDNERVESELYRSNFNAILSTNDRRISTLESTSSGTYDLHCATDQCVINLKDDLNIVKQKMLSIENTVMDHAKRARNIDNVDKLVSNHIKTISQKIDQQHVDQSTNLIEHILSNKTTLNNIDVGMSNINTDFTTLQSSFISQKNEYIRQISNFANDKRQFEKYVKNGMQKFQTKMDEISGIMENHIKNTSSSVQSTTKHVNDIHSEIILLQDNLSVHQKNVAPTDKTTDSNQTNQNPNYIKTLLDQLESKNTRINTLEQAVLTMQADVEHIKNSFKIHATNNNSDPAGNTTQPAITTVESSAVNNKEICMTASQTDQPIDTTQCNSIEPAQLFEGSLPSNIQTIHTTPISETPRVFTTTTKRILNKPLP